MFYLMDMMMKSNFIKNYIFKSKKGMQIIPVITYIGIIREVDNIYVCTSLNALVDWFIIIIVIFCVSKWSLKIV